MPSKIKCLGCKGAGTVEYLISQHGSITEKSDCTKCNGKGYHGSMTDEEDDYKQDYW